MSTEAPQSLTQNTFWCEMGLKPHPEPAAYIMADYRHASEAMPGYAWLLCQAMLATMPGYVGLY